MTRAKSEASGGSGGSAEEPQASSTQAPAAGAPGLLAELRWVALDLIDESPLNHRKHFNLAKLQELAESIKTHGVMQPVTCRLVGSGSKTRLELVFGHRRYRASKLAKLETILVTVRELSDIQVLEAQAIENTQREDPNVIEEATAYQLLIEKGGYTYKDAQKREWPDVKRIAEKIGKSERYVGERLQLARKLAEEIRELCLEGHIPASHAIEIARLDGVQQYRAALDALGHHYADDFKGNASEFIKSAKSVLENKNSQRSSLRSLQEFIARNVHVNLHSAAFSKSDAELCKAAGPCTLCPKRSDFEPLSDKITGKSQCLDPDCFASKLKAHNETKLEELKEETPKPLQITDDYKTRNEVKGAVDAHDYQVVKEGTKGALPALDLDTGKTVFVKPESWAEERTKVATSEKEAEKERAKAAKKREDNKVERAYRRLLLNGLAQRLKEKHDLEWFIREWASRLVRGNADEVSALSEAMGWDKRSFEYASEAGSYLEKKVKEIPLADLQRVLELIVVVEQAANDQWLHSSPKKLLDCCKEFDVDTEKAWEAAKEQIAGMVKKKETPLSIEEQDKVKKAALKDLAKRITKPKVKAAKKNTGSKLPVAHASKKKSKKKK